MKKYFTLFGLQLKSVFFAMPGILAGTLLFGVLMALMAAGAVTAAQRKEAKQEILQVAVVYPRDADGNASGENVYIQQAFEFLGQIDTIKNVCAFVPQETEAEAVKKLKKGEFATVIVIPDKFISSILYGENHPVKIIFEKNGVTTNSAIFREMLQMGAADLSTAQAGAYAVEDVCKMFGIDDEKREQVNITLSTRYFAYALDRNIYYETVEVQERGGLSLVQFYAVTGIVLLILLGAIPCASLLRRDDKVLREALIRRKFVPGTHHVFKVCAVSIAFFTLLMPVYILASLSAIRYPQMGKLISTVGNPQGLEGIENLNPHGFYSVSTGLLGLFVLLFTGFCVAGFLFRLTDKTVSGVMLLFLASVAMLFAAGGLVPQSMLPPAVSAIGKVLPAAWMCKLCAQILIGAVSAGTAAVNMLFAAALLCLSAVREAVWK